MESTKYIYWQDGDQWLGYLQDYPDYWTQGTSVEDLDTFGTFIATSPAAKFQGCASWLS